MRDNWWHVVLATPIAIVAGGAIGGYVGGLLVVLFVLLYPVAMRRDAKYLRANVESGGPNVRRWTIAGLAVLLTVGILSYVVSPYYLYRRRAHST